MGYTVKVSNVSQRATERDIYDFFAFSGEISSIQTLPSPSVPGTQEAYVTFQDERSLETALLLTGAVIADKPVTVELAEGYVPPTPPHGSSYAAGGPEPSSSEDSLKKAESMMAGLLARGYILGKDAMDKAKALDEKHEISTKAKAQADTISRSAAELDSKYLISQKLAETTATVSKSLHSVDEKYRITSKSKEALSAAEASLSDAGTYVMQNKYVSSGTSWLMGALGQLKTIVADIQQQTSEKVLKAEEQRITGQRVHTSLDDEGLGNTNTAKASDSMGLDDHGPPIAGAAGPGVSTAATSFVDNSPSPASFPASSPTPVPTKLGRSSADPPVF